MLNYSIFRVCRNLKLCVLLVPLALAACSPQHDWRQVQGADAPFVVLLPAKPATHEREINLDGVVVSMSITAAQVDGATYAVGSAKLPNGASAPDALRAMRIALVRNINGSVKQETPKTSAGQPATVELEAIGTDAQQRPVLLVGRFFARDDRVYQVLVIAPQQSASREAIDTFLTGFQLK